MIDMCRTVVLLTWISPALAAVVGHLLGLPSLDC